MCDITASPATCCAQVQQHILHQVDAVVDNFAMHDPRKLLDLCQVIVDSTVHDMTEAQVHSMYHHIMPQAACTDTTTHDDHLQCLCDYLHDWVVLELAKRYA